MTSRVALASLLLACAQAAADPLPEAEQLYRDGQAAYDQTRYDDAIAAWERSYEVSHLAALHYNIAQAYRLRAHPGDCATARRYYQTFVQSTEPSPQRELAQKYLADLSVCAASAAPNVFSGADHQKDAPLDTGASPQDRLRTRKLEAAALGVGGVALLVTGMYFGHHASALSADVSQACSMPAMPCQWSLEMSADSAGRRDAALGWTFDALGVASLLGGAALYWFGVHNTEVQVSTELHSRTGAAVFVWSGRW
jgi:tetratricopeptide (TPR) repeat protein